VLFRSASEGIEAYDSSTPPWRGTAALPALRAGEVVEETIAVNAPASPGTLAGRHVFHVRTVMNAKNHIEQSSSAAPVLVDVPTGLCRNASLRPGVENMQGPTPTPTPRPVNVPAQPPRQQRPINEPAKHN